MSTAKTHSDRIKAPAVILMALAVTVVAAYLHSGGMHNVIAWDEAHYILAASEGIVANAWETGSLNGDLRHWHGPMMSYMITASTAIFGNDEWAARLPTLIIAALTCGLVVLTVVDLTRHHHRHVSYMAGLFAGLMLATSPASIELAGVVQPHAYVILFIVLNIWTLCRYVRDLQRRDAVLFGLTLTGQFLCMEYGPVMLIISLTALLFTHPDRLGLQLKKPWIKRNKQSRWPVPCIHRDIIIAAATSIVTLTILWPAGVLRGGAAMNFGYYLLYAAHGHPILFQGEMVTHLPKYAYALWYGIDYPLLLAGMCVGTLLAMWHAWQVRTPVTIALAIFTFGLIGSVHAAHIMMISKSIFMIPAIAIASAVACAHYWQRLTVFAQSRMREAMILRTIVKLDFGPKLAMIILLLATVIGGQTTTMTRKTDPNEQLASLCETLAHQANQNDTVFAQGWPMVRYLLQLKHGRPDIVIEPYDPRNIATAKASVIDQEDRPERERATENNASPINYPSGSWQWAITIGPTTRAHPECIVLKQLQNQWKIVADRSLGDREYRLYREPTYDANGNPNQPHTPIAKALVIERR